MKKIAHWLSHRLRSARFAALVISVLISFYFLGLVIPQKRMFATRAHYEEWIGQGVLNRVLDATGLTDIYLSPVTLVLLCVFFMNLIVVMLDRAPRIMRRAYVAKAPPVSILPGLKASPGTEVLESQGRAEDVLAAAGDFFRKRRWFLARGAEANAFMAVRNRLSPLGFLLFHLSFILCLLGGLALMYTRFSGNLVLTEGQTFEGDMAQFRRGSVREPKVLKALPALALKVEEVRPTYAGDVPSELEVSLRVFHDGAERMEIVRVNEPVRRGAVNIIVRDIGVSPLFRVLGPSGQLIDAAYVSLDVLKGGADSFVFDSDPRYNFRVLFYPDYVKQDGAERTKSLALRNPAVHLLVEKEGRKIYEGTLLPGEAADIEPYDVEFGDVRYWVDLQVVREYGRVPLMAGFALAAMGLVMRLVFFQKTIKVAVERESGERLLIYLNGQSEYYPDSFRKEMGDLREELKRALGS